ncbi:apotyrosinase chaperone MelC1 [Kitasatospora mediocidica]|uniref:apotyrosinase chaperone MelC1 n=1 Tax=Kitasatospora mediocidica TaxID=58352 RepID=UPI0005626DAA|nr:tyrosinase cofactor [Kitasatospora mediocidica]
MSEQSTSTDLTRRRMLQGAVVALTAATGTVVLGLTGPGAGSTAAAGLEGDDSFDEVFQQRRIQGMPMAAGTAMPSGHQHGAMGYQVLIDGRELHMMRNADGTWISVLDHYRTFSTPRALARSAVIALHGAQLVPISV